MPPRLRSRDLVARGEEVALLDDLLVQAGEGAGAVVVVRGEPGVGKSRLVGEVVERARRRGVPALVGRAVEGGGAFRPLADALLAHQRTDALPPPEELGPFAGALATLVPGWSAAPAGAVQGDLPLLVSEGLVRLLRLLGEERGAVLVVDDLHWADADTLTVLDRLAGAVADAPVVLVLVARDDPQPALERLAATHDAHVLALRRLSDDAAHALAAACADGLPLPEQVRRHVVEHAEGLPFLLEELLRGLVDSGALVRTAAGWEAPAGTRTAVPASFASVVHDRLTGLGPDERRVVETAAVLGRTVDWRLLVAVTGQPEAAVLDALRHAVERGLLSHDDRGDAEALRFVHALTREAVLERLLRPERVALAASAAAVVEQAGDHVLAASLHAEAGDPAHAARLLLRAADAQGSALGTREDLLRRAASLAPDDADVATALVEVLALAGRATEARELGDPLLARTDEGDPRRARLALTLARACLVAQNGWAEVYLAQAGEGPAVSALAGHVAFAAQRPAEAEALALSCVDADDPAVRCEALELVGRVARLRDRVDEAEAAFTRALDVADRSDLPLHRVRALAELGTLDLLGPARHDRLAAARELAVQTGQLWTAAILDLQIMACHGLRMEHAQTLDVARRGIELAESLRLPVLAAGGMVFVAIAQGHTGRHDEMHATLDEAEHRLRDDVDALAAARYVRATPALVRHDLETVRAVFEEGSRIIRTNPSASPTPYRGLHALVETVLGDGHAEREDLRASGATVQSCNRAAMAYADAVAAARAGEDPAPLLAAAEEAMAPLAWRRHHARLLVAPCAVRDGWGRPVEWLREAMAHFEGSGDEALARACREELRRAGAPVPRRSGGDAAVPPHLRRLGVTPRETEVLAMVAEGLTSAAIAERLFLSPRTVETHVANLLTKTGAGSRAGLAKYVRPVD